MMSKVKNALTLRQKVANWFFEGIVRIEAEQHSDGKVYTKVIVNSDYLDIYSLGRTRLYSDGDLCFKTGPGSNIHLNPNYDKNGDPINETPIIPVHDHNDCDCPDHNDCHCHDHTELTFISYKVYKRGD